MRTTLDDKEIKLATVFEQSRQNAIQISEMRQEFSALREAIERLGDKLNVATAPNFSVMAAWAGILLSIIGMVATPVVYHYNSAITSLDAKLQKEYQLVNDTQRERQNSLNSTILELDTRLQREFILANSNLKETSGIVEKRIDRIDDWLRDDIKADLQELRERRLKAGD